MFLEFLTLVVLALVLLVKYGTSAHMVKLNQRQLELENKCKEFQGRYRTLVQERKAAEGEEKELKAILQGLENRLNDLKGKLSEQEERNRELQGRLFDS